MPPPVPEQLSRTIETPYRSESGRVLETLVRLLGDLELAEEAMREAFAAALWNPDLKTGGFGRGLRRTVARKSLIRSYDFSKNARRRIVCVQSKELEPIRPPLDSSFSLTCS